MKLETSEGEMDAKVCYICSAKCANSCSISANDLAFLMTYIRKISAGIMLRSLPMSGYRTAPHRTEPNRTLVFLKGHWVDALDTW